LRLAQLAPAKAVARGPSSARRGRYRKSDSPQLDYTAHGYSSSRYRGALQGGYPGLNFGNVRAAQSRRGARRRGSVGFGLRRLRSRCDLGIDISRGAQYKRPPAVPTALSNFPRLALIPPTEHSHRHLSTLRRRAWLTGYLEPDAVLHRGHSRKVGRRHLLVPAGHHPHAVILGPVWILQNTARPILTRALVKNVICFKILSGERAGARTRDLLIKSLWFQVSRRFLTCPYYSYSGIFGNTMLAHVALYCLSRDALVMPNQERSVEQGNARCEGRSKRAQWMPCAP
jgi:hypothetical protein